MSATRNIVGLRLDELTETEKHTLFVPGSVLSYSDMSNPRTEYKIKSVEDQGADSYLLFDTSEPFFLNIDRGFQYGWKVVSLAGAKVVDGPLGEFINKLLVRRDCYLRKFDDISTLTADTKNVNECQRLGRLRAVYQAKYEELEALIALAYATA